MFFLAAIMSLFIQCAAGLMVRSSISPCLEGSVNVKYNHDNDSLCLEGSVNVKYNDSLCFEGSSNVEYDHDNGSLCLEGRVNVKYNDSLCFEGSSNVKYNHDNGGLCLEGLDGCNFVHKIVVVSIFIYRGRTNSYKA